VRKYAGKSVAQYLQRWKGYGPEYDEWRSLAKLGNCMDLVEEYEARQIATGALKKTLEAQDDP